MVACINDSAPLYLLCKMRPYKSVADFKHIGSILRWNPNKFDKTFKPFYKSRSNFDIDHVLDKGSYP